MLRRSFVIPALALAFPLAVHAADPTPVPYVLTHEGRLVDASDKPVDDTLQMTFSLHETDNTAIRQPAWQDTMSVQVGAGHYAVVLGDTVRGGTKALDLALLTKPELFLSVTIAGVELLPRLRLASTAYALRSARAATAEGVADGGVTTAALADGSVTTAKLADGSVTVAKLATSGGKAEGLDADLLDGLDSTAFAPAAIEAKVDAIEASTDTIGALSAKVASIESATDSLEGTLGEVKAATDSLGALATTAGTIKTNTDGLKASTDAIQAKTDTIPTLATAAAVTALAGKVDQLLQILAPSSCPSGMTLIGGAGNKGAFCIDNSRQLNGSGATDDFAVASRSCSARGLHVCTYDQWSEACATNGLNLMDGWQWVASTAGTNGVDRGSPNNYGLRPVLGGGGGCWDSGWGWGGFGNRSTHGWRCCR